MTGRKYIAEMIGTAALVFCGCGAIIVNDSYPGTLGHLGVSLVFGLVVMAMIYSVGNISGAHLNPAVTLGFWFAGRMRFQNVLPYIFSQALGAILASFVLYLAFPEHGTLGATLPKISLFRSFSIEILLSFLLMFVVLNVSAGHMEKGIMAGVAIGGVVVVLALVGGPLTGASMNPARSLGPAVVSGHFESLWIYLSAPTIGAFLARPTCRWIQGQDCCVSSEHAKSI